MSKSRKSNQGSVLKKQKPKAQKSRRKPNRIPLIWPVLLGLALLGFGFWGVTQLMPNLGRYLPKWESGHELWDIAIRSSDQSEILDQSRSIVLNSAKRFLGRGTHEDLSATAKAIQKIGNFSDIRITKVAPRRVIISLIQRQPVFCVEADKIRLVSSLGDIYGIVQGSPAENCPGPLLTGLF